MNVFSNITVSLCCFGSERVHDLYAAVFNILMHTREARIRIAFNEANNDEVTQGRHDQLKALASVTNNDLTWTNYDASLSKAQMIAHEVEEMRSQGQTDWYLNVDDDYMIPYETLSLLAKASRRRVHGVYTYVYGQFDIINYRNYEDWSADKLELSDVLNFVRENGMRCLPNHLVREVPRELITLKMPGQSTGAYMMLLDAIKSEHRKVLAVWPKGKRGYDEYLCSAVGGVELIWGSNSYHTDRTRAHVDGIVWQEDVFRDDLLMDGSVKGRLPSKLGEKSIPRGEKPADAPSIPDTNKEV